jgi:tetratricopeptide (TPR) repeat protein
MVRRFAVSAALLVLIALTGVARADQNKDADIEAARIHFQAGKQYYDRGHYNEAIGEFREAYRLSSAAALLYNIAQAYERMGDLPHAREYLQRYIDSGQTEPGELPALQDKLRTIDKRIADQKAAEAARKPPPPTTAPALPPPPEPVAPTEAPRPYKVWKWVAAGAGVVSLVLSVSFVSDMNKQAKTLEDAAGKTPLQAYVNDLPDAYSKGQRDSALAIAFGVGGLAIAGTAVVLFVIDGKTPERPAPQARILPVVGPGTAGAAAAWRF